MSLFTELPEPPALLDHTLVEVARRRREGRDRLVSEHPSLTLAMIADARGTNPNAARQWLHRLRDDNRVVSVQRSDGTTLVPAFQFDLDLEPRGNVAARTARLVDAGMQAWAVWRWWVAEHPLLDTSPIEALDHDREVEVDDAIDRLVDPHG